MTRDEALQRAAAIYAAEKIRIESERLRDAA